MEKTASQECTAIKRYPQWSEINLSAREVLHPRLVMLPDGISEFTFANIYLFRHTYDYKISLLPNDTIAISGKKDGKSFFMLPCGLPDWENLEQLFSEHDYLKNLSESNIKENRVQLEIHGYKAEEDRDNFDYIYKREDLADLSGRKYHKKRNHIKTFINNYNYQEDPITKNNIEDALYVLEKWREEKGMDGDYKAAKEALLIAHTLRLRGYIYYIDGEPVAYTLGEALARGRMFAVHFEKALSGYKGIYQFINHAFAATLPKHYKYINREQDLGIPGLRQAKMSYHPSGFVRKYKITKA
ncbi:phosphatidylglycerol lysyltransferase domain-containing protein [Spirochaetia bacterium 38H-sp]|uniref:Phosphatidylglycerol lysyltransferase domain-containing protein n=1 Tax=Rarispira pelagica TaxID=3141764 RepID=A0ABU9UA82_9SPIR